MNTWTLERLVAHLREEGIRRFYLVTEDGRVRASHARLRPLAEWLAASPDYAEHEGFFVELGATGVLHGACVHRTCRGQGAGGVRNWHYDTVGDYLTDGLRLARGMTHKNALAGLWWGGGKGVMALCADEHEPARRRAIYEEYGAFISSLRGSYVTAEDVGTSVEDMAAVFRATRFTTCIPERLGGSGNPSVPTARGVLVGMRAALEHRGHGEGVEGKTVAVQGLGHVGAPLVEMLMEAGAARVLG
ncbi:MAG: Glu/Leu/Phe/Val dehydrogenase dimerization domain-containing protein, partial [Polyangiaceae bacterium]